MHIEQITHELTWRLRQQVLYPEQKFYEMGMDEDEEGIHFGAFVDNKLVGVVSLFQKGSVFQFRKLAVAATVQQQRIGSGMLAYITNFARDQGGTMLWCNARTSATGFYLKAGFTPTGNLFTKNGFKYEVMEKSIVSA